MYNFDAFTSVTASASRKAWMKRADAGDGFSPHVSSLFDWIDKHLSPQNDGSVAYGVFPKGKNKCVAVCQIVLTSIPSPQKQWVRQLNITLEPNLSTKLELHGTTSKEAVDIYMASILGLWDLRSKLGAKTLKIYGRSQHHLQILSSIVALAPNMQHQFQWKSCKLEGRWLAMHWS